MVRTTVQRSMNTLVMSKVKMMLSGVLAEYSGENSLFIIVPIGLLSTLRIISKRINVAT